MRLLFFSLLSFILSFRVVYFLFRSVVCGICTTLANNSSAAAQQQRANNNESQSQEFNKSNTRTEIRWPMWKEKNFSKKFQGFFSRNSSEPFVYIYIVQICVCIPNAKKHFLAIFASKRNQRNKIVFENIKNRLIRHSSIISIFTLFCVFSFQFFNSLTHSHSLATTHNSQPFSIFIVCHATKKIQRMNNRRGKKTFFCNKITHSLVLFH